MSPSNFLSLLDSQSKLYLGFQDLSTLIPSYLHRLKLCTKHQAPSNAKKIHAQIVKSGLSQCQPLPNTLLNVYGKCNLPQDAQCLFEEMTQRDHVSWASILTAYNLAKLPNKTVSIFHYMFIIDRLQPDHFVYATLLKACASLCALRLGKQVHARFVLSPFVDDDVVKSSLVDMYAKCGLPSIARSVFDSILVKTSVSWTAMLSGYARSGLKDEAMELFLRAPARNLYSWTALISGLVQSGYCIDGCYMFIEMRREGVDISDPLVLSSVVGACSNLAVLGFGRQAHGLVIGSGFESCLFISNALVDMYAKCSDILAARNVFYRMLHRDVVSWTSMIVGAAQHGRAEEALDLYDQMVLAGVKPNEVTFIGLIYACSHAGFIELLQTPWKF
ncbi:hypothetical protein OIU74_001092 [Salix koriyanagi]|uniref:Pentatricopeptide repeat-containing protein n=1 Tax=Salix koriyanagi TaxID=2511006 RepID=A0A9Q0X242_9ROSI|nr:hypothetical protein OIU74_001092 [Salix koriyanagi]